MQVQPKGQVVVVGRCTWRFSLLGSSAWCLAQLVPSTIWCKQLQLNQSAYFHVQTYHRNAFKLTVVCIRKRRSAARSTHSGEAICNLGGLSTCQNYLLSEVIH